MIEKVERPPALAPPRKPDAPRRRWVFHLASRASDLGDWDAGRAPARAVKEKPARTVWRVEAGAPALFIKRFRSALLGDRARREARLLQALHEAAIPCPVLVATGKDARGSYLATEEVEGARVLGELLAAGGPDTRLLLGSFARLLRRLHDAGFEHLDLHAGNVLVRAREFVVMDVHRARRVRSLSAARRRRGVAYAAYSFLAWVPLTEVFRFFRRYGLETRQERRAAWEEVLRWRARQYARRQGRCTAEGGEFGVQNGVYYRKATHPSTPLGASPSTLLGASPAALERDAHRMKPRHALRLWKNAHGLSVRGIPTPRLDACGPGWVAGAPGVGPDLLALAAGASPRERHELARRLGRFVRRMHDRGVFHGDLTARSIRAGPGEFSVENLDQTCLRRELPQRERWRDAARLLVSSGRAANRTDAIRFLRAYFGWNRSWWARRREIASEILRRVTEVGDGRRPPAGRGLKFDRYFYPFALRLLPPAAPGRDRLLDLGCGAGEFALLAARRGWKPTGVDWDPDLSPALAQVGVEPVVADLNEPLPFPDGSFDAATLIEVIEHVPKAEFLLSEVARILKPGGILLLSTPNNAFYPRRLRALFGREPDEEGYHYRFWIRRKLEGKAAQAGFRVEARNSFGYFPLLNILLQRKARGLEKKRVPVPRFLETFVAEHFCWRLRRGP